MQRKLGEHCIHVLPQKNQKVYAIGDIHGCVHELEVLIIHLERREKLSSGDIVVFLGDYIDRGFESKQVIDLLISFKKRFPKTIFLKGNHEDMFLSFLGLTEGTSKEIYLDNGGIETILSYGIRNYDNQRLIIENIPQSHLDFFTNLNLAADVGCALAVHGGLRPGISVSEQREQDLLWIREEFLVGKHTFGQLVIFGHTPFKEIYTDLPYKLGIDTALVFGNKLSCVELMNGKVIQIRRGESSVLESKLDKFI